MFIQSQSALRQIAWQRSVSAARRAMQRLLQDESGQDLIEYALIAAVVGLGTLVGVHGAANTIINYVLTVTTTFSGAI
jgi:pilus assembly protein Flp/PilA